MLIVLDTNIIVSALKTPGGKANLLLEKVLMGEYTVCISSAIMSEYREVLNRSYLDLDKYFVEYLLSWFVINGLWIEPLPSSNDSVPMKDESDRKFFDVAKCLRARLVTGNFKHYPVHELVTSLDELIL